MKKIFAFIKGAILSSLALAGMSILICIALLATRTELFVDNALITIYSSNMYANINFGVAPTLLIAVIGGVLSVRKYNDELINSNATN